MASEEPREGNAHAGLFRHIEEKEITPGEVVAVAKDSIHVQTGRGVLVLKEVQLEGKRRMPVRDFLLGCPLKVGEILT